MDKETYNIVTKLISIRYFSVIFMSAGIVVMIILKKPMNILLLPLSGVYGCVLYYFWVKNIFNRTIIYYILPILFFFGFELLYHFIQSDSDKIFSLLYLFAIMMLN